MTSMGTAAALALPSAANAAACGPTTLGTSCDTSGTVQMNAGTLGMVTPAALDWGIHTIDGLTHTYYANTVGVIGTSEEAIEVDDPTGTLAGWHVTAIASPFTGGTHTIDNTSGNLLKFGGGDTSGTESNTPGNVCETTPNGTPRPYFTMTIAPGSVAKDTVVFRNTSAATEVLRTGVTYGATAVNSGTAFSSLSSVCSGVACWVTGIPAEGTLQPHGAEVVPFQVAVPAGTPPSQYLAGITAQPAVRPQPVRLHGNSASKVVVVNQVTISVAITVGKLANLDTRLAVTGVTAAWSTNLVQLSVRVANQGQQFTRANGAVSCALGSTTYRYRVYVDTVLPEQAAVLPVDGYGMKVGTWQCAVRLTDSGGTVDTWSGDVTVPNTEPPVPRRVANGDYVDSANTSIPSWAMVLFVLGGLILLSLWAVLLRRNRMRGGSIFRR